MKNLNFTASNLDKCIPVDIKAKTLKTHFQIPNYGKQSASNYQYTIGVFFYLKQEWDTNG